MILFGTALPEKNGCQNHDAFSSVGSLRSHGTGAVSYPVKWTVQK